MGHVVRLAVFAALLCLFASAVMWVAGYPFDAIRKGLALAVSCYGLSWLVQYLFRPTDPRLVELHRQRVRVLALTEALEAKAKDAGLVKEAFVPSMTVRTSEAPAVVSPADQCPMMPRVEAVPNA